ncbi:MAG: hypothetical protein IT280_04005 [Ignavibacteria bacterium]|nr:hypothetical protein [Ignavibacteria bacterium]
MNTLQSETELKVIKKIMEDSRNIIADNGWHYIYWGAAVTIGLISNYVMVLSDININSQGLLWFILMTCTWVTEVIIEKRISRDKTEKTFAGELLGTLWFAAGITMFIFGFIGTITKAYSPLYICPVISTMLGTAYIISGAIQQAKWLQIVSIGWWSGAIYTFLFPSIHTLLIFALMIICFQITPGIILYRKWKRNPLAVF